MCDAQRGDSLGARPGATLNQLNEAGDVPVSNAEGLDLSTLDDAMLADAFAEPNENGVSMHFIQELLSDTGKPNSRSCHQLAYIRKATMRSDYGNTMSLAVFHVVH